MNQLWKREGLFFKAKSIISYFYGIVLWTSSTLPCPMHNPKNSHERSNIIHPSLLGLKTLIYHSQLTKQHHHQNPNSSFVIHSCMSIIPSSPASKPPLSSSASSSSSSSPPPSLFHSNSILGDLIGTDSGVHLNFDINPHKEEQPDGLAMEKCEKSDQMMMRKRRDKLYPPPIPLLARTGNLPGHMPWILTRHYENGKLILTEERVKHHEYFEAEREDGRLILNLVSLDNMVTNYYHNNGASEQQKEIDELMDDLDFLDDDDDDDFIQETDGDDDFDEKVEDHEKWRRVNDIDIWGFSVPKSKSNGRLLCGEVRKCLTYAGRTTMSILSDINDVSNSVNACSNVAQLGSNPFAFVVPTGTATVCGVV